LTVLDKVEGKGFLRAAPHVGQTIPVEGTAVGRLYLALAPSALQPDVPTPAKLPARASQVSARMVGR
jgi:DNA-binding IclR family transcriptional regulator